MDSQHFLCQTITRIRKTFYLEKYQTKIQGYTSAFPSGTHHHCSFATPKRLQKSQLAGDIQAASPAGSAGHIGFCSPATELAGEAGSHTTKGAAAAAAQTSPGTSCKVDTH